MYDIYLNTYKYNQLYLFMFALAVETASVGH